MYNSFQAKVFLDVVDRNDFFFISVTGLSFLIFLIWYSCLECNIRQPRASYARRYGIDQSLVYSRVNKRILRESLIFQFIFSNSSTNSKYVVFDIFLEKYEFRLMLNNAI